MAEQAVLSHVLAKHPMHLTVAELMHGLSVSAGDERDELEQAIQELAGVGLLYRQGEVIVPSGSAVRFDELAD